MFPGKRNYSLGREPESRAIEVLLDCSNTLRSKNASRTLKVEEEMICPWLQLNKKPLHEVRNNCTFVKTNRNFAKTYNQCRHKPNRDSFNKTVLSTPKSKVILDEIENYNYMSSNVINLTR
jgi:hypothetical protein